MVMTAQEVADAALALDRLRRRAWSDGERLRIDREINELLGFGTRVDLRNATLQENPSQG